MFEHGLHAKRLASGSPCSCSVGANDVAEPPPDELPPTSRIGVGSDGQSDPNGPCVDSHSNVFKHHSMMSGNGKFPYGAVGVRGESTITTMASEGDAIFEAEGP
ncbi:unnamed protein product [Prorocentrum cordatum]|uniref:Uncharacterized protein n=1 Tax=Prorocentrum cordatum TaxID=2364126 RepID=A0ABN9UN24_9DINO|nr:unnamed protein product [Polarella glacialis]